MGKRKKSNERNNVIKAKCKYIGRDGKGAIDYKGETLYIPYLIDREVVKLRVTKGRKEDEIEPLGLIKESKNRVEPKCPYYYECGGCHLQHMNSKAQAKFKETTVKHLLGKYGKVDPIILMDSPYNYRNKVHSTFAKTSKGKIVSGLYEATTHTLIPIDKCIIQDTRADRILKTIRHLFNKYNMRVFNEETGEGFLRHVLIRTSHTQNEVMVVFVTGHKTFHSRKNIVKGLLKKHPEIKTIVMNINNRNTSVVLGEEEYILYGNGKIKDTLCGLDFYISAKSFYQINPIQTEKLYNKAIEYAELTKEDIVLDAYCGIGTIGLIASKAVKRVVGVEVNGQAIKNAKKNAQINSVDNVHFVKADASEFMLNVANEEEQVDVVFMDPPRDGSDRKFLSALVKLLPRTVVYVSCNPDTQARDLEYLTSKGYTVEKIQPVDMFPQTYHVETVAKLSLNSNIS